MLKEIKNFVNELNKTNSSNEKLEILKKLDSSNIRTILEYVHNPYKRYWIKSKACKKRGLIKVETEDNILKLLDNLNNRVYTGHDAIDKFNSFIDNNKEYEELLYNILDRDLKTRCGVTQYNKVYDKCIPTFNVALASTYSEKIAEKTDFKDWTIDRKLDGIRIIMMFKDGAWKGFTRGGNEFTTIGKIQEEFENRLKDYTDYVFDGELCIVDDKGNENFSAIAKEWNRKDYTMPNCRMKIFDMIKKEHFDNEKGNIKLKDRYAKLLSLDSIITNNFMSIVEQFKFSEKEFKRMLQVVEDENWEGLMLKNGNSFYEGKRTKNMLKVKQFFDEEFEIVGAEDGDIRVINKETGLEETINALSSITIKLPSGDLVDCGSGFSLEERKKYKDNHNLLIGKIATIQYFEKTKTNGKDSLRFPVKKVIFENGRDN